MSNYWTFKTANASAMPNMASWQASNSHNEGYLVQASWPLGWNNVSNTQGISESANVVYTVDGNAMFGSATDVVRRRQEISAGKIATIVIAISYLLTSSVYSPRRTYDMTPPSNNFTAPPFMPSNSTPAYGGADHLLDFINNIVNPFVSNSVFPNVTFNQSALFGHSLGGLFALHALYTKPESFDTYLVASPSIWWNNRSIVQEEKNFYKAPKSEHPPNVWLSYGTLEQNPERLDDQSEIMYKETVSEAKYIRMADNVEEMSQRLNGTNRINSVKKRVYQDEDHATGVAPALGGALEWFMSGAPKKGV